MSTLNVSNISDGTDTVETGYVVNGSAKAWVNTNSGGSPLSSFNSFANTNYAVLATGTTNSAAIIAMFQTILVGSFKINTRNADKTSVDAATRSACFGDLA